MTGTTCPSCGHVLTVARTGADGVSRCPRCGDPFPEVADPGVTMAHTPDTGVPSTVLPDRGAATVDGPASPPQVRMPAIPGYEVLSIIGRGGMGVVYKARQLSPRRVVAVKLLLGGRTDRFRAEVAAVARLQHPNVVQIHEVGDLDGRPFFSMEYVTGGSLAARLRAGPLPPQLAAELVAQIARAVQHAHDRGIVHRDLKPANVLLAVDSEPGTVGSENQETPSLLPTVKIADFGLAKHLEGSGSGAGPLTQSGAILGTPSYMAPEQAKGKVRDIGPAVDVYALGAILYECLLGRPPFREDSQLDTLVKVMSEDPEPPRKSRPGVPRDLETICLKCLRKEPAKRYASARELAEDLERFLNDQPITARSRTKRERLGGWMRRRRDSLFLVDGAALAAVLALVVLAWWPKPTPPAVPLDPPPPAAAELPPDLKLVPPESFAFATIRLADLWANPATTEFLALLKGAPDFPLTLESFGTKFEEEFGVRPENIERITIAKDAFEGRDQPFTVIRTVRPYSRETVHAAITKRQQFQMQETGGMRLYSPTQDPGAPCCLMVGDRLLVFGDWNRVERIAAGTTYPHGPQTPALQRAAGTHTVVVGMRPPRELVDALFGKLLKPGTEATAVAELGTLNVAVDLSPPTGPTRRVAIAVGGWVAYPSADAAEAAHPQAQRVVRALCSTLAEIQPFIRSELVTAWLEPIAGAVWERDDFTLQARARVEIDLPDVGEAIQESQLRQKSANNLMVLAAAMKGYHDKHGRFPPAAVRGADGTPLYSWRVLLLPHLPGGADVYRRFHLNRAWDHPSNKPLLKLMPAAFAKPNAPPGAIKTVYQVVGGDGGMFDSPTGRTRHEVPDGMANTFLIVESATAVPWTKPEDLPPFGLQEGPALGSIVPNGFNVAMVDGTVRFFPHDKTTPELLRGFFTRDGGEMDPFP